MRLTGAALVTLAVPTLRPLSMQPGRCPAPAANLPSWVFGPLVGQGPLGIKADESAKAKNVLGLVSRAATARGKADLDALRAFASIIGIEPELKKLEESIGVSPNATDQSDAILSNLFEIGGAMMQFESARQRRLCLTLSIGLSVLLCEAVHAVFILAMAWLLGGGALPVDVAIGSRALTRPFRLSAEIWSSIRIRRMLNPVPPRQRLSVALRAGALVLGALAAVWLLVTQVARPRLLDGTAISAACVFLRARVADGVSASEALSKMAMSIKPLRALLELSETDAWLGEVLSAAARHVQDSGLARRSSGALSRMLR